MSGVVVITATHQGERRGMTVSAIASLSLDPPMIVTCLNAASATQEVVRRAGAFAVNILAEDQEHLAVGTALRQVTAVSTGGSNSGRGNLGFLKKKLREHFAWLSESEYSTGPIIERVSYCP